MSSRKTLNGVVSLSDGIVTIEDGVISGVVRLEAGTVLATSSLQAPEVSTLQQKTTGLSYNASTLTTSIVRTAQIGGNITINGESGTINNVVFNDLVQQVGSSNSNVVSLTGRVSTLETKATNIIGTTTLTTITSNLSVSNYAQFNANVLINGDLLLKGNVYDVDTPVIVTDSMSITNVGTGTALVVRQDGVNDIVDFQDDGVSVFRIANGGEIQNNPTITALQSANTSVNSRIGNLQTSNVSLHTRVGTLESKTTTILTTSSGNLNCTGFVFSRSIAFSYHLQNASGLSISTDASIFNASWTSTKYIDNLNAFGNLGFTAPISGLYRFEFTVRFADSTALSGVKPVRVVGTTATTLIVWGDGTLWAWEDGASNRRFVSYSMVINLASGERFDVRQHTTATIYWINASGSFLGAP